MDVAIISDTHFGFDWGSEREDDPFDAARDAFEQATDADLILMPGDLFDARTPRQEVLSRAADIFDIPRTSSSPVNVVEPADLSFDGIPVVAIHGTHDRRSKGFVNPVELLEDFDCLHHIHLDKAVFKKDGERVAVHGMSGVPEAYARDVLHKWSPEPVADAYNMFMFHQNVEGFMYTDESVPALTLEDLPTGFDLLVDGHIHWPTLENREERKNLVFAGSTVTTQLNKQEADMDKGFLRVDTREDTVSFTPLNATRSFYYEEVDVTGLNTATIHDEIGDRVQALLQQEENKKKKPLIRIVLTGDTDANPSTNKLVQHFQEDALLTVTTKLDTAQSTAVQRFDTSDEDIFEQGMARLQERFETDAVPVTDLFDAVTGDNLDAALTLLEDVDTETLEDALATDTGEETEDKDPQTTDSSSHTLQEYAT